MMSWQDSTLTPKSGLPFRAVWLTLGLWLGSNLGTTTTIAEDRLQQGRTDLSPVVRPARTNIVFLLADDQRHDALGSAGHPFLQTPHLDGLAAKGVRFSRAYAQTPVCWVSRASFLTGLTARQHIRRDRISELNGRALGLLFPDRLRAAGYRVAFFGKWHLHAPADFEPAEHFDEFEHIFRQPYFKRLSDGTLRHETDLIADRGIEWLQRHVQTQAKLPSDQRQPFSLQLWFNAAHAEDDDRRPGPGHYPWPPSANDLYSNQAIPPPRLGTTAIFESQPAFLKASLNRQRFFWGYDTPEKYEANVRGYLRMISGIDTAVGRILKTLQELDVSGETLVIYTADNGYYLGDRGFQGKWSHYDESVRIPLIVYDPRLPAAQQNRVCDALVQNLDVPSTILAAAGVAPPPDYEGKDLLRLLREDSTRRGEGDSSNSSADSDRGLLFLEHVDLAPNLTWEGIRTTRYVYARYFDQSPVYEFAHDLQNDPDQLVNLADEAHRAEHNDLIAELRLRCDTEVARRGGPLPPLAERLPRR